jgi:hypothetical protein
VEVEPARLASWLSGFEARHGGYATTPVPYGLCLSAEDGAVAECHTPPGASAGGEVGPFLASALAPHRIGLLLARRGGVAAGVALGDDLVDSKVGSRYVQGRTAAGGRSQHRFARRRENQARAAAEQGADLAARVLLPVADDLAAVVTGGDRRMVADVLADARLARLAPLVVERFLEVPDPRQAVLAAAVRRARSVVIRIVEPA